MSSLPKFEDRDKQEVKYSTCYMCACRCGIKVTVEDRKIRYIEGTREHPINKGVLCAKGNAGIMKQYSPAKLSTPLLRKPGSKRGDGEYEAISMEKALDLEYRFTFRASEHGDFLEGIRAQVIDKDRTPKWTHASPADLTQAEIDAFVEKALKSDMVPQEYEGNNWRPGYTCANLRQYGYYQYRNCLHYYRYHGRYYR